MNENTENQNAALKYKGRPLVRKGNVLCFGNSAVDRHILILDVKNTKSERGLDVASEVAIFVRDTENNSFVKSSTKNSLYEAFELGEIWLESYVK